MKKKLILETLTPIQQQMVNVISYKYYIYDIFKKHVFFCIY